MDEMTNLKRQENEIGMSSHMILIRGLKSKKVGRGKKFMHNVRM